MDIILQGIIDGKQKAEFHSRGRDMANGERTQVPTVPFPCTGIKAVHYCFLHTVCSKSVHVE